MALSILFGILCPSHAAAQFTPAAGSPYNCLSPVAVVSGDFNLDGTPDLAVAAGNGFAQIFLGNPNGTFGASHQLIAVAGSPSGIAIGDFDRDGFADLVVTSSGNNTATLLFGDGTGSFAARAQSTFQTGSSPAAVVVGDFNADGFQDLAIVNMGSNNVTVLLGNGAGFFTPMAGSPFSVGSNPESIAIGDFNGDGRPDLAVPSLNDNNVTLLLNAAGVGFSKPAGSPFAAGNSPSAVSTGDFNGDGNLDLAVANNLGNNVTILLGNGIGGFSAAAGSPVAAGANPQAVAMSDFNGDGKLDLAVANSGANTVSILLGDGSGGFSLLGTFATGRFPNSIVVADFNGDGKSDVLISNAVTQNFSVLLNTQPALSATPRTLSFTAGFGQPPPPAISVALTAQSGPAATYSFTSNQPWLIASPTSGITTAPAPETVSVSLGAISPGNYRGKIRGTAPGYFGTSVSVNLAYSNPSGTLSPLIDNTFPELDGPSIAVGDLNGDGIPDIAYVNDGLQNLIVMLGRGGGMFTQAAGSPMTTGALPRHLVIGDFNNDHRPDLAFANVNDNTVQVLLGDGRGGFRKGALVFVSSLNGLAAGDFNNDGNLDLIAIDYAGKGVQLVLGHGDGTFSVPSSGFAPVGTGPAFLAVGDFNGDGKLDVAVTNATDKTLTVLLGNGLGGFTSAGAPIPFPGFFPGHVVAEDLNGDGLLDLAVALSTGNIHEVAIQLGNGNGTFTAAAGSPITISLFPVALAVGDFDGDGKPDIAVGGNRTLVLLGDGTGRFTPQTGSSPTFFDGLNGLVAADFNGDGKLDLFSEAAGNKAQFLLGAPAPTATVLQATNGVSVQLTAQVSDTGAAFRSPTGNVTFYDGITPLNSVPLSAGTAIYLPALPPGVHTVLAVYLGDGRAAGSTSNTVTVTVLPGSPVLSIAKTHFGSFTPGQTNAFYTVTVSNLPGAAVTSGTVTFTESLPPGLSLVSLIGQGWNCAGASCTRSDPISGGFSYPEITVTVSVASNASSPQVNQVSVSGGGSGTATAGDSTTIVAVGADFNGDGHRDVLWQDPITGRAQVWLLGGALGATVIGAGNLTASNPWHIVGVGDFNGDGRPDVVWQDPVSGAAQVWFLGGTQGNVVTGAASLSFGNTWRIMSIADFNGDGHPDLIWQDQVSGFAQIWFMGGAQGTTVLGAVNLTVTNSWRIVGTGDFNGDGRPDVLWQDPVSGAVQVWYLGGAQGNVVTSAATLTAGNAWRIASVGDFNGDGHPDVVWQDPASGTSQMWLLGGAQGVIPITGSVALSGANAWRIVGPR